MSIRKNGICFVAAVWGSYVEIFLSLCLPSLMANNNIPNMSYKRLFLIYTTEADKIVIENSNIYKQLQLYIETRIITFINTNANSYYTMTCCHQQAFDYIDSLDAGIFIVVPDGIYSNNFCTTIEQIALNGARLISTPNFSIELEACMEVLSTKYNMNAIDLSGQELMQFGLQHLGNYAKKHIWDDPDGFLVPSVLLWKVGEHGGFLGRYFWGVFTYIHPTNKYCKLHATYDTDYIYQACPDTALHYASLHSDDALILEASSKNRFSIGFPKSFVEHVIFYAQHLNPYQIYHSKNSFRMSTNISSEDKWLETEAKADNIMQQVYKALIIK